MADEAAVLAASLRRCCLCYYLDHNKDERKGQIAHVDRDRSRSSFEDLVFLCLDHHDAFDSSTSQSKNYTPHEVRKHRDRLYREFEEEGFSRLRGQGDERVRIKQTSAKQNVAFGVDELNEPWLFTWLIEGKPELFAFKSAGGFDGVCRIERIDLLDGRTAIVCEEVDGNPGMSVTNAVEFIALQLCRQFRIKPNDLVLLEYCTRYYCSEEDWSLVEFAQRDISRGFDNPSWRSPTSRDWKELGFRPRKRRAKSREPRSMVVREKVKWE